MAYHRTSARRSGRPAQLSKAGVACYRLPMDVFLIPAGASRYQLYCEVDDEAGEHAGEEHAGWRRRAVDRFVSVVGRVDRARHAAARRRADNTPRSLWHRMRDRTVCWLAEKIAEQRLLWHLRRQHAVDAWFPDDMTEDDAWETISRILQHDARRHGRWAIVHGLLAAIALVLTPIPGPNLLGYYFTFRVVGHYLSRLGARHGLDRVTWNLRHSATLTELRAAIALEPETRRHRVADIASRLHLEHLAAFLERVAIRT